MSTLAPARPGARSWWWWWVAAALPVLLLGFVTYGRQPDRAVSAPPVVPADEQCLFGTAAAEVPLLPDQAGNAATIVGVVRALGMPEKAAVIALATALQESSLHNLDHGDRDSLGLFQQRPSQGWGRPEQIQDPAYATKRFLQALKQVPGYLDMPVDRAAQEVQRSAFPDAYATREVEATTIAGALAAGTVACHVRTVDRAAAVAPLRCDADPQRPPLPGLIALTCRVP